MGDTPGTGLHILIIGAGISGLLLAQGLKMNGIPFSIFEAEQSQNLHRTRHWGMSLQWALPMLKDVLPDDLLDRLQTDTSVDPHYFFPETGNFMPVYNAATGELLKAIPLVQMLRVSRQKMRAACREGLTVEYGKVLESIQIEGENDAVIRATFTDGTIASGSLIIGADGANSALRRAAFKNDEVSKAVPSDYGGINIHACYGNAEEALALRKWLSPIQAIGVHPKGYWLWLSMQDVPHPERPEGWTFQLQWTFKLGAETVTLSELDLPKLKDEADGFAEPWRTAWRSLPDDTKILSNRISVWAPEPLPDHAWGGRVALVGDAAHAMSFHRGQGMNHGIADAVKLTEVLCSVHRGERTQRDAVLEYEAEMIKRAGEEVTIGKMNTQMMHDWDTFTHSAFMQRGGDKNE